MEITDQPTKVLEQLVNNQRDYAVSADGTLLYVDGGSITESLVFVDRSGNEEPVCGGVQASQPRFSPDGRFLAVEGIRVLSLADCSVQQLSDTSRAGSWTPDGRRISFNAGSDILIKNADGTGDEATLITGEGNQNTSLWSPDGDYLYYTETRPNPGDRTANGIVTSTAVFLWKWDVETQQAVQLNQGVPISSNPTLSRDGQWIACSEVEGQRSEVFVARVSEDQLLDKRRVASDGAEAPIWSGRGDELFFRRGYALVALRVETEPTFRVLNSEVTLFHGPYSPANLSAFPNYDYNWTNDRFVVARSAYTPPQIRAIFNWQEHLRRLAVGGNWGVTDPCSRLTAALADRYTIERELGGRCFQAATST